MFIYFWISWADVTAEEFIRRDEHGKTRHGEFKEFLAKLLPAKLNDVIVFSVMNRDGKQTDVRFAVRAGPAYYRPEKLHAEMAAFKTEVCSLGSSVELTHTLSLQGVYPTPQWKNILHLQIRVLLLHSKQKHLSNKCLIQAFSLLFNAIHTGIVWLY